MAKRKVTSKRKELSPTEDAALQRKIDQAEREAPAVKAEARRFFAEHARLRELMAMLKAEREHQGVSLADAAERIGMDRSNLHRLETDPRANPTLETVQRLAHALGKTVRVELVDEAA